MREMVWRSAVAAVLCLGFVGLVASPASGQTDGVYTGVAPPVVVLSNAGERPAPAPALPFQVANAGAPTPQAAVQGLAFTGADIVGLVTVALVALALGAALTRRARPRTEG